MFPLRTEIENKKGSFVIGQHTKLLTVGSCFAEVIGNELLANKMAISVNPFGTVFNPLSMFRLLRLAIGIEKLDETLVTESQGVWHHYDFHSSIWGKNRQDLLEDCKAKIEEVAAYIETADILILTFGTAYGYFLKHNDFRLVSNCHKTPANQFTKALLGVERIMDDFEVLNSYFKSKSMKVILTVSPVRHTRDTLTGNAASKAVLKLVCHYLSEHFENVDYFPASEIMIDDLRDYRFYKPDLIHPNEVAESYIFEQFAKCYFSDDFHNFMDEWQPLKAALNHRPMFEGTTSHQKFLQHLLQKLNVIGSRANVKQEILKVEAELEKLKTDF